MEDLQAWIRAVIAAAGPLAPKVLEKLEALGRKDALGVEQSEFRKAASIVEQSEFKIYRSFFAKKSRNRRIALIGLRLRQVQKDQDEVDRLLAIVTRAYLSDGRRAAQAVQCGGLELLLKELSLRGHPEAELRRCANLLLDSIGSYSFFLNQMDTPATAALQLQTRLTSVQPPFFLVAGSGTAAEVARLVAEMLRLSHGESYDALEHQNHPLSFMTMFVQK